MFNNREIATAIWLALLAILIMRKSSIRQSLSGVFSAFANRVILTTVALMIVYTTTIVAILWRFAGWHVGFLKDTVFWFIFAALVQVANFGRFEKEGGVFRTVFRENITLIAILSFLLNTFTLPLVGELFLVPITAIAAMSAAFAETKDEYRTAGKVVNAVLALIGFALLFVAFWQAVHEWRDFANLETLRKLCLPVVLSILFSPFLFGLLLYSAYEMAFIRISLRSDRPDEITRYAKRRLFQTFGIRLADLKRFMQSHGWELMHACSQDEIDALLSQVLQCESHAKTRGTQN